MGAGRGGYPLETLLAGRGGESVRDGHVWRSSWDGGVLPGDEDPGGECGEGLRGPRWWGIEAGRSVCR